MMIQGLHSPHDHDDLAVLPQLTSKDKAGKINPPVSSSCRDRGIAKGVRHDKPVEQEVVIEEVFRISKASRVVSLQLGRSALEHSCLSS